MQRIAAKREAAVRRKAARLEALQQRQQVSLEESPNKEGDEAVATAPRGGGLSQISNRRASERRKATWDWRDDWKWHNDRSLATADATHRQAGLFAIDTVNPNGAKAAAEYMSRTSADMVLIQEVKLPTGYPVQAADQTARGEKWSIGVEPCLVTEAGGRSTGVAVAARSYIGMSKPTAVKASRTCTRKGTLP